MASLIRSVGRRIELFVSHKLTSLASALTLAGFALWDVVDQTILENESILGVEHGVVVHGIIMVLKSAAEFFENSGEAVKTLQEGQHAEGKPESKD